MRRSISTAIVFCILWLTTRPVSVRAPFASAAGAGCCGCAEAGAAAASAAASAAAAGGGGALPLLLPQRRLDARNVAPRIAELGGLGLLAGGTLHAQRELLLAQFHQLLAQLRRRQLAQLLAVLPQLSDLHQRTCRFTNEVDTESFEPARRNASRAVGSSTPSISNSTLPGCTRAT